jgi:hypothetical protein
MSTHDRRLVGESEGNHNATIVLTGAPTGIGRTTALAIAERAGHGRRLRGGDAGSGTTSCAPSIPRWRRPTPCPATADASGRAQAAGRRGSGRATRRAARHQRSPAREPRQAPTPSPAAADAFAIAQVAIGLLRQQLSPSVRVHGIVTEAGTAPNAIPDRARGSWYVRADALAELDDAFARVRACFEAGALAAGCTWELTETSPRYAEYRNDEQLATLFAANAAALGRDMDAAETGPRGDRLHRYGQRLAAAQSHPPLPRHRLAARGQPPARLRRRHRDTRRRPSRPRRRGPARPDRDRRRAHPDRREHLAKTAKSNSVFRTVACSAFPDQAKHATVRDKKSLTLRQGGRLRQWPGRQRRP